MTGTEEIRNISPYELLLELETLRNKLSQEVENYKVYARAYPEYKHEYKKLYSVKYLENKVKNPKATITELECLTYADTAHLVLQYETSKSCYEAQKEVLNSIRTQIESVRSQLSWLGKELEVG